MDGNTTLRIELVSLLKRKRAGSYYHIRDALFVVVSSFITLLFLLSPRDLIGSSSLLPEPAYLPLLALFSDSTETSKGVIPPKGIAPLDPEGKGGSAPEKFPATPDSSRKDTTGLGRKGLPDTSYVVCYDSTARLKHFTYVRKDQPHVGFFPDRLYPLFAPARPATYQRQAVLDSSGKEFRFSETVMGENVKLPLPLSFHEYLAVRRKSDLRKLFAEEARKPKAFQEKNDLGELLSSITKITIPVPANPLFSIFGKNEINVNISGAVDIKAGFRSTKSDQTQVSRLDQTRNEPDFQQEVQVNVNGMIGDKLSILADWNTQRTFEYENQLKIKYTGYDDEIVQSVEAGNVSLNTPSTFIGSSAALFGVKARFQTGPLTLTALASQKKGQIKEVSVSGGAQEVQFDIRPFNYSTNHFFVDTLYQSTLPGATAAIYEEYYQNEPARVHEDLQIIEEEVWVQRSGSIPDPTEREGIAYITLDPRPVQGGYSDSLRNAAPNSGSIEKASFVKLERSQYELTGDGYIGVISLNANVQDQQVVAVAYRRGSGAQFGEFSRDDTSRTRRLVLKMLKPQNLQTVGPGYPVAWKQMLKNVYQIPGIGRNLKKEGFILDIYRTIPGRENENSIPPSERLLRVFGFDNYTTDGTAVQNGDNGFDFRPGKTISQARAEIIFPTLRPFDDGIKKYYRDNQKPLPDTSYYYPEIYDTTKTFSQQSNHDHYLIKGKASGEVTSKYPLGFNIVEGSVQVYLDGRLLTPNIDYTVDYIVGEVVIRNERALVPGANLQIKFEQNDLFQLASKTLLGARGDLAISKNTNFGFTVMNLNQQTLSEKVRLGEEPNKNTILGVDGQTKLDLPFLTNAIDALPLLETRDASEIRITGEAAYMIPDPNTKKSTIPSDNGEGIAYIDDFEGARRTIPLGISYSQWYQPSPPKDGLADSTLGFQDTTKMFSKGKTVWFNVLPTNVRLTDVYPRKQPGNSANDQLTVLDLQYYPLNRGMYNYSPRIDSTLTVSKNWGGIMKPISIAGTNLITENVNFIEFWVLLDLYKNRVPIPKIRIDLGSISEDVIPNERLNSEDVIGGRTANGTLQADEDVGLDMLDDAAEIARYGSQWGTDPSGDNYAYNNSSQTEDFSRINGTDQNKNSPNGLIPDTEDLNSNGALDIANRYMQYEVSLDTNVARNHLIVGGSGNSDPTKRWFQFRIPIRDYTKLVGMSTPNFENVESFRISFLNAEDTVALRFADIGLVGNQWQEIRKDDSTFAVSVVSIEDNPSYQSPPGVVRERDKTQPDQEILANEQSLSLVLNGVPSGETRQAVKYYTYRPLDLINYRQMKMFVHGDARWSSIYEKPRPNYESPRHIPQAFFRFGLDSLNFYEYRGPIYPGWDTRNEISVKFSDLSAIKQLRDSLSQVVTRIIRVEDGDTVTYRVVGSPSLTQIRYLAIGVTNRDNQPLYGQAWYNELRLTEVDDTPGWAYRFDTALKLADLATVSFNYSEVDPNFHTLEQRFGSRQTGTNWGLNASAQLEKFFPNDWVGTSFPFSYSRTVGRIRPKYLPNSDVLVDEAAQLQHDRLLRQGLSETEATAAADEIKTYAESYRVADTYAAPNFRFGLPSQAWYIRDTFNKLAFSFTYTHSSERNPATVHHTYWEWNAKITYSLNFSPDYYFQPFKSLFDGVWFLDEYKDIRFFYAPTNFSWSVGFTRARDKSLQRTTNALETITPRFTAFRQFGFGWKLSEGGILSPSGTYNVGIESSLLQMEFDENHQQRPFSEILDDIFFGDKFVNFGNDTRYAQQNQFSFKPIIPNMFNLKKYLDLSHSYGVDYSWQNTLVPGDIGKSAGWNSNINLTMNLKLKQLFDPLFEESREPVAPPQGTGPRGRGRGKEEGDPNAQPGGEPQKEPIQPADSTALEKPSAPSKTLEQLKNLVRIFIKIPFLDYDNINFTFTQTNTVGNSGVVGSTGFVNFWRPFQPSDIKYGPSRLYQLGLISDPSGHLGKFGTRSTFPFFGWGETEPGLRAPLGQLQNTFRQQNRIAVKTSRNLWEGARIDFNWNVGWAYSRTQNVNTDSVGVPTILNSASQGNLERSFLSFPDVLFLGIFKSSLKDVSKRYTELKNNGDSTVSQDEKMAQAFEEGFEALPFFRKVFGQYWPRINWSLRWDGLERIPLFAGFASRVSLEHSYAATYSRQYENRPAGLGQPGVERTTGQRNSYGFTPLVGMNFTFKELLKGSFGSVLRYNSSTSYDLATSSKNIVEQLSREISITLNYSRRGFEIPFFGLSLNNDLDLSASYSLTKNSRKTYDVTTLDVNTNGTPLEGSTRTVIEPRIKYVLSSRVTASIYYRYTKIAPDDSGSRIPGSTVNEAGLDIHIAIQ